MTEPLLSIDQVSCHFEQAGECFAAVDKVSFSLEPGEVLGLVGESGSGKSTLGRLIVGLAPRSEGRILLNGRQLPRHFSPRDYRQLTDQVQMVFQDSYSAMNPRMRVVDCIAEPALLRGASARKSERMALQWLERVGLSLSLAGRYPHELSGGQRQRVGIARALINRPRLLICDEPVSALDVSVQAQIVNLLREIQHQEQLTILFIAHDLAVVNFIADRVLVMYRGRLVEKGGKHVFQRPAHPYTEALLNASPVADPLLERQRVTPRASMTQEEDGLTAGCPYAGRCAYKRESCTASVPLLQEVHRGGEAACFYPINQG